MKIERIQNLAKNLSSMVPSDVINLNEIYSWLFTIRKKYEQYFHQMDVNDYIKLLISIWSYKSFGDFEQSQRIFQSLFFVSFISTELIPYTYECENCNGNVEMDCPVCDDGHMECNECGGSGMLQCPECDGDGRQMGDGEWEDCENCEGVGEIQCNDCTGDGWNSCDECDGRGRTECDECDGRGEIESETKVEYTKETYLSWNNELKNLAEIRINTADGLNYDDYERLVKKDSLKLSNQDSHGELNSWVESDLYYIYNLDDEGKDLQFDRENKIISYDIPEEYLY